MKISVFCIFLFIVCFSAFASEVRRDKNYVYYISPFNLLTSSEQEEAVNEAKNYLAARLEKVLPKGNLTQEALKNVREKELNIQQITDESAEILENTANKVGIKISDLHPSAIFIYLGGTLLGKIAFFADGSLLLAIIAIPSKVKRINVITKVEDNYWVFQIGCAAIPVFNFGFDSIKSNGDSFFKKALRIGGGIIFSELKKPSDFSGFTMAASAKLPKKINLKAGVVLEPLTQKYKNTYVMFGLDSAFEFNSNKNFLLGFNINAGMIIDGTELIKAIIKSLGINPKDEEYYKKPIIEIKDPVETPAPESPIVVETAQPEKSE